LPRLCRLGVFAYKTFVIAGIGHLDNRRGIEIQQTLAITG